MVKGITQPVLGGSKDASGTESELHSCHFKMKE